LTAEAICQYRKRKRGEIWRVDTYCCGPEQLICVQFLLAGLA
jgi:hypothetical protein